MLRSAGYDARSFTSATEFLDFQHPDAPGCLMLNKQVSYELGTSEKTIKVLRARVVEKMGAESFLFLVRFAEKVDICFREHSTATLD